MTTKKIRLLYEYILSDGESNKPKKPIPKSSGWVSDADLRKRIEIAAMEKVVNYFSTRGYRCVYVHKENKGWDIEIFKGKRVLQIEVKGTQSELKSVELTPNEYKMMKSMKSTYRICIVSHALDSKKQAMNTFYFDEKFLVSDNMNKLRIDELVSARLTGL